MVVFRPVLARGLAAARRARPTPSSLARKGLRSGFRRGYASGHDAHPPSSDIPWLLGAIGVTLPGCYYLWPAPSHGDAHHGHDPQDRYHTEPEGDEADGKENAVSEASPEESEPAAEESAESKDEPSEEPKEDSKDDSPKEDSKDDSEGKEDKDDKEDDDSSAPEKTSNKKVDGVQFKGKTSAGDDNNEMQDTRKREPDSKGAFKKRIDSAYQKDLGAADKEGKRLPEGATAAPPSNNSGAIDSKQAGISNTATRHSTQIDQDPEKSKKGEGVPDTAKSSTTIDPKRPQK